MERAETTAERAKQTREVTEEGMWDSEFGIKKSFRNPNSEFFFPPFLIAPRITGGFVTADNH